MSASPSLFKIVRAIREFDTASLLASILQARHLGKEYASFAVHLVSLYFSSCKVTLYKVAKHRVAL